MTKKEVLSALQAFGNEKLIAQNIRHGIDGEQFGVKMGDIRTLAKKIKSNHSLALELWDTKIFEARMLAILIIKPLQLSIQELNTMVSEETRTQATDWFSAYVIKNHPDKEFLRDSWMHSTNEMCLRVGWSLTAGKIAQLTNQLEIRSWLEKIAEEMPAAHPKVQWTMNFALAYLGIHHPEFREEAIALGEKMGLYRDYPVSKGCTSPFAPIWIREMVERKG